MTTAESIMEKVIGFDEWVVRNRDEGIRERLIDNLTYEQEQKLQAAHAKNYYGYDDDMTDDYEEWLVNLSLPALKQILK
jgi:hypothetical protein